MVTTWKLNLSAPHTVQVEHNGMSGALLVKLDGKELLEKYLSIGDDFEYPFTIKAGIFQKNGKSCLLRFPYKVETFGGMGKMETWDYDLFLDGVKQTSAAA